MATPEISLELLGVMIQRVLDGQSVMRDDIRNVRRRMGRLERGMVAVQRRDIDAAESEDGFQEQLDALTSRLERLEQPR